jgi:hypothetical protein
MKGRTMKYYHFVGMAIAVCGLTVGCSKSEPKPAAERGAADTTDESAPHAHGNGPNGGVVFDFGRHHAEFTVDHGAQEATVLVLGEDAKTPVSVSATELILTIKETKTKEGTVVAPMTVTLSPVDAADGKASKFVGKDTGIGNVADFEGTVSGQVDGKPAMGEFKE